MKKKANHPAEDARRPDIKLEDLKSVRYIIGEKDLKKLFHPPLITPEEEAGVIEVGETPEAKAIMKIVGDKRIDKEKRVRKAQEIAETYNSFQKGTVTDPDRNTIMFLKYAEDGILFYVLVDEEDTDRKALVVTDGKARKNPLYFTRGQHFLNKFRGLVFLKIVMIAPFLFLSGDSASSPQGRGKNIVTHPSISSLDGSRADIQGLCYQDCLEGIRSECDQECLSGESQECEPCVEETEHFCSESCLTEACLQGVEDDCHKFCSDASDPLGCVDECIDKEADVCEEEIEVISDEFEEPCDKGVIDSILKNDLENDNQKIQNLLQYLALVQANDSMEPQMKMKEMIYIQKILTDIIRKKIDLMVRQCKCISSLKGDHPALVDIKKMCEEVNRAYEK